ncbi:MAG: class I tRNA ligase family protein, partial [Anaerolineae bacterium]
MVRLYNDLTQRLETLSAPEPVSLYVCGITPYDTTHLGHAFTYCSFDVLVRFLEWQGRRVRYVQNVTDVDDDILRKANEVGEDWAALGNYWVQRFAQDMATLNVRPPDLYPRATEAIPEIIALIEALLARGDAYERGGCVYLRSPRAGFGRLSRLPAEEWLRVANDHGNHPDDPLKEDPLDPVLWQAHRPGEPAWSSPWGQGRPGWHIECAALSMGRLGPQIDVHGGGADLVFPHHEAEIALAQAITQREPFARFWLHTGLVCYRGAKMSKSLGNLILVGDLLQRYDPDALRLYLASHHYRQPWCHDDSELAACAAKA